MSDGQLFLFIFILIYVSDCLVWLGPHGVAFLSVFNRNWTRKRPIPVAGTAKGGLVVAMPLPPLGSIFVAEPFPVSLTEKGVGTLTVACSNPGPRPHQTAFFAAWEEIESVTTDRRWLEINRKRVLKMPDPFLAHWTAETVGTLVDLPASDRHDAIQKLVARSLNPSRVRRRMSLLLRATRWPRYVDSLLFVATFLFVPFAYWRFGASLPFFYALVVSWALMWQVTLEYFFLHRRLFPGLKGERWQYAFLSLTLPQHAIRSMDALSRDLLRSAHPAAVAKVLCRKEEAREIVSSVWRDAEYPVPFLLDPSQSETARKALENASLFHTVYVKPSLEAFLGRSDWDIVKTPSIEKDDFAEGAIPHYCPRCLTVYGTKAAATVCEDCGGIETVNAES